MKSKIMSIIFTLALFLSACGAPAQALVPLNGDVWAVQPGTTIYWIEASLQGAKGTQIFQKGSDMLFTFPVGERGYGFTMIRAAGQDVKAVSDWARATGGKANLVNYPTIENFLSYMKEQGWKAVPAAKVAKDTAYSILKSLTMVVGDLWTIFVLPAGTVPNFDCPPGYYQCSGMQ